MKERNKKFQCCICGGPKTVEYMEQNRETGKIEKKEHIVPCLGHYHLKPHLWNLSPDYDKYRMLRAKQRTENAK